LILYLKRLTESIEYRVVRRAIRSLRALRTIRAKGSPY
jgi:hypothetical protein